MKVNLIILFLLSFLISCGKTSETVKIDNTPYTGLKYWNSADFPIKIHIPDDLATDYRTAIENAGQSWNNALNYTVFTFEYDNTPNKEPTGFYDTLYDSIFAFYKQSSWNWPDQSTQTLASTLTLTKKERIIHADILFNFKYFTFDNAENPTSLNNNYVDMQSVIVHELGHFLGLGHNEYPTSVMYPSLMKATQKRNLSPLDITNINNLYPNL